MGNSNSASSIYKSAMVMHDIIMQEFKKDFVLAYIGPSHDKLSQEVSSSFWIEFWLFLTVALVLLVSPGLLASLGYVNHFLAAASSNFVVYYIIFDLVLAGVTLFGLLVVMSYFNVFPSKRAAARLQDFYSQAKNCNLRTLVMDVGGITVVPLNQHSSYIIRRIPLSAENRLSVENVEGVSTLVLTRGIHGYDMINLVSFVDEEEARLFTEKYNEAIVNAAQSCMVVKNYERMQDQSNDQQYEHLEAEPGRGRRGDASATR